MDSDVPDDLPAIGKRHRCRCYFRIADNTAIDKVSALVKWRMALAHDRAE